MTARHLHHRFLIPLTKSLVFVLSWLGLPSFAKAQTHFVTPIILDLNHNKSLDLTSVYDEKKPVYFDLTGDRYEVRTGWLHNGDGFLVVDHNNNGIVDHGGEIFGEYFLHQSQPKSFFKDGFAALASYDSNQDGSIDKKDLGFKKLKIWVDKNVDGLTQKGELRSLASHSIQSLQLNPKTLTPSHPLYRNQDNEVRLLSSYRLTSGARHLMADVWLRQRPLLRKSLASTAKSPILN